jgi:hypothetical protein
MGPLYDPKGGGGPFGVAFELAGCLCGAGLLPCDMLGTIALAWFPAGGVPYRGT